MTTSKGHSREDQVRLLTEGVDLPLPPLWNEHLTVIVEMLAMAWRGLFKSSHGKILTLDEPEINAMMETRLNQILDEDPCWEMLVASVVRRETISFDGSSLEKRPDLSLSLTGRNPNFPLVVECKLIDAETGKTVRLYCGNQGLGRFLKGEYAWPAREAIMLAYVRDRSTIAACLTPYLQKAQRENPDPFDTAQLPEPIERSSLDLARSRHRRRFCFIGRAPNDDPGPIDIWHLWLSDDV